MTGVQQRVKNSSKHTFTTILAHRVHFFPFVNAKASITKKVAKLVLKIYLLSEQQVTLELLINFRFNYCSIEDTVKRIKHICKTQAPSHDHFQNNFIPFITFCTLFIKRGANVNCATTKAIIRFISLNILHIYFHIKD